MLQEVQVFFISPLTQENKKNQESLQHYKYFQYMGQNKNASILCSLIHYAFNKQQSNILELILDLITKLKNQADYVEFKNLIQKIKNEQNPIQKFFQNLYMIDQKNEIAGRILFDFCKRQYWIDGSQILYNDVANYFKMRISFLNCNEIYGIKQKDSIDIIFDTNKKFYYLIPELIMKNIELSHCTQCKNNTECINLICKHKQCYKCLLKKSQTETIKCCGKTNIKKFLMSQIKKIDDIKQQNEYNQMMLKYYENSNQLVPQIDKQLQQSRSDRNYLHQDNYVPKIDTYHECNLCLKKLYYQTQLFVLQDCKHQLCEDCKLEQQIQKVCPIKNCCKRIEQNEQQNNLENKEQKFINQYQKQFIKDQSNLKVIEYCQKCFKTFNYKLFEINNCSHKFCNSCIQLYFGMKYDEFYCLNEICHQKFTKQEYDMYIQNKQSFQNAEVLQKQQQNTPYQLYFDCENCQNKRNDDQKYTLNCGHSVCYTCIIQNVQYIKPCCYVKSLDKEYQEFRMNLFKNCIGCQCPFQIKNLHQLKCNHEFCLGCCQNIYLSKIQRCLDKNCERYVFLLDDLYNFIYSQKLEQSKEMVSKEEQKKNTNSKDEQVVLGNEQKLNKKDNVKLKEETKLVENNQHESSQIITREEEKSITIKKPINQLKENSVNEQKKEEINLKSIKQKDYDDQRKQEIQYFEDDSDDFDTNFEEEIILYQQFEEIKSAQEMDNEFCKGNCTYCNQEFSSFNRKQQINCKSHQIGVCCSLMKFNNCPQCEQILSKKTSIKQKLILPTNPIEEEGLFESTTIKSSYVSYYPLQLQQTYQGQSEQLLKLERQRNQQNSAIKRNITTDTVNKRVLDNQQIIDDKYKYKHELITQNELCLAKSYSPYVQQSYYPNNRINYGGGYDHRNRYEIYSRDHHLHPKITTGYSGLQF